MSDFRQGQLVAVRDRDDEEWILRVYDCDSAGFYWCYLPDRVYGGWWNQIRPAEEVWPELFIDKERRAVDQAIHAVEMEQDLVQRLRRQIRWLCKMLVNHQPQGVVCSDCFGWFPDSPHREDGRCATCWEETSLKAVAEEEDDG